MDGGGEGEYEKCWGPCFPFTQGIWEVQVEDLIYFEITSDCMDCVLSAITLLQDQTSWGVTS